MDKAGFLWGASTSAHQVEGNNFHNDWWAWEQASPNIENSGLAADHYNRFADDFALAQSLGHNAHRLSLEWSRIELSPGEWNQNAIDHYRQVLQSLRQHNLCSFVTLHHFTNPLWLAQKGGWLNKNAPRLFARYANKMVSELGDLVDFWITINEPMVYATQGYWHKRWPPGAWHRASLATGVPPGAVEKRQSPNIGDAWKTMRVIRNLANGHEQAYHAIHEKIPHAKVGLAKHLIAFMPGTKQLDDRLMTALQDWWFNQRFYSLTKNTHDFIGVNFYFTHAGLHSAKWTGPVSDLGWALRPEGLTHVLLQMRKYRLPIYITENGLADAHDTQRAEFLRSHLRAVEAAQARGADVRGYLHWSLLDNFEWSDGFAPRFGLIEVDYKTMTRKIRPSAYVFRAIIERAGHKRVVVR